MSWGVVRKRIGTKSKNIEEKEKTEENQLEESHKNEETIEDNINQESLKKKEGFKLNNYLQQKFNNKKEKKNG